MVTKTKMTAREMMIQDAEGAGYTIDQSRRGFVRIVKEDVTSKTGRRGIMFDVEEGRAWDLSRPVTSPFVRTVKAMREILGI